MANWSTIYPISTGNGNGGNEAQSFIGNGLGFNIADNQIKESIITCNVKFLVASVEVILTGLIHAYFTDFSISLNHISTGLTKTLKPNGNPNLVPNAGIDFNGNYTYKNGGGGYANNGSVITSGIIINSHESMNFFVNSQSDWKLIIYDSSSGDQGNLDSWTLKLYS